MEAAHQPQPCTTSPACSRRYGKKSRSSIGITSPSRSELWNSGSELHRDTFTRPKPRRNNADAHLNTAHPTPSCLTDVNTLRHDCKCQRSFASRRNGLFTSPESALPMAGQSSSITIPIRTGHSRISRCWTWLAENSQSWRVRRDCTCHCGRQMGNIWLPSARAPRVCRCILPTHKHGAS